MPSTNGKRPAGSRRLRWPLENVDAREIGPLPLPVSSYILGIGMTRIPSSFYIWIVCFTLALPAIAQNRDRRIADLTAEVAQLKVKVADQDARIAQLEAAVKALQMSSVPAPIPPVKPLWQTSSNWMLIRKGMSRAEIVDILGEPTRETAVMDTRTLYYGADARSTTTLSGTITLEGDRLIVMTPPEF
jgi:hypothetical protein